MAPWDGYMGSYMNVATSEKFTWGFKGIGVSALGMASSRKVDEA
jgi:hypothetical protein